jgi:hypothetical protein
VIIVHREVARHLQQNRNPESIMHVRHAYLAAVLASVLVLPACSDAVTGTDNGGPWLGDWAVNFLALDDNGV